ncbi:MAG: hypothetical protein KDC35_13505 [Acidobacteria bacterium]|nr:hypothetical protein [Acidobacteriota bacterium]
MYLVIFYLLALNETIATWDGGVLTQDAFDLFLNGQKHIPGSEEYYEDLAKVLYLSIYEPLAYRDNLHLSTSVQEEIEVWEKQRLANLYRSTHAPQLKYVDDHAIRSFYEKNRDSFYTSPKVSFHALFLSRTRYGDWELRDRLSDYKHRWQEGANLISLIEEERKQSGEANGTFSEIAMGKLAASIQSALMQSQDDKPIEISTALGLFWIHVFERKDPVLLPFEQVQGIIRHRLHEQQIQVWESQFPSKDLDEALAQAARSEHLSEDSLFQKAKSDHIRWQLADAAFYRDCPNLIDDYELQGKYAEHPHRFTQSLIKLITVRSERLDHESLDLIRKIQDKLSASTDLRRTLESIAQEPQISVIECEPLMPRDLYMVHPDLPEIVKNLHIGDVSEPKRLKGVVPEKGVRIDADLIVFLDDRREPPLEDIKPLLYELYRSHISSGFDVFFAEIGPRWNIQLVQQP